VSDLNIKTAPPGEFFTQKVDDAWLAKQAAFMMKLDDHDLYTIVSYTSRSHQWITPFMRTGKLPGKKELKNIVQDDMLTPLFDSRLTNTCLLAAARGEESSFAPGIATAADIEMALEHLAAARAS
jgi:hypothetical protein